MTNRIARSVLAWTSIGMVALVAVLYLAPPAPRHLDVTADPPAPRSAPAIPTAEAPDPVTGVGSGTSASGTQTRSGAPDGLLGGLTSGAPLTRPALPGRGGISEADPTPGPVASASRPAGGVVSAPSRRPNPTKRPAHLHLSPGGPTAEAVSMTWYCGSRCTVGYGPGCYCAAISPDLATWRGRLVRAWYGLRHVDVRIVDCNCQAEHSIDAYAVAFASLAPLSVGRITVRLELL